MSRVHVVVRDAVETDAPALCSLWADLLATPAGDSGVPDPEQHAARSVAKFREDPENRIMVAETEEGVVGCAFLRVGLVSPLHDDRVVQVTHLQVDPVHTETGVGRSLLESAVSWAERRGIGTVLTATAASDRDANRFFAKLGLAQVAALRGASVPALRARLPHDPVAAARSDRGGRRGGRRVSQVVAARRSQRRSRAGQIAL